MQTKLFNWTMEEHSVRDTEMDNEHKLMFEIVNRLFERAQAGAARGELIQILKVLISNVRTHFAHEEALMARIGYEGARTHALIHKEILEGIEQKVQDYQRSDGKIDDSVFTMIKVSVVAHIQGSDRKYSDVLTKAA